MLRRRVECCEKVFEIQWSWIFNIFATLFFFCFSGCFVSARELSWWWWSPARREIVNLDSVEPAENWLVQLGSCTSKVMINSSLCTLSFHFKCREKWKGLLSSGWSWKFKSKSATDDRRFYNQREKILVPLCARRGIWQKKKAKHIDMTMAWKAWQKKSNDDFKKLFSLLSNNFSSPGDDFCFYLPFSNSIKKKLFLSVVTALLLAALCRDMCWKFVISTGSSHVNENYLDTRFSLIFNILIFYGKIYVVLGVDYCDVGAHSTYILSMLER